MFLAMVCSNVATEGGGAHQGTDGREEGCATVGENSALGGQ